VIYALLKDGEPVYVGSSRIDAETRLKTHRATIKKTASWNADLAEFLSRGTPEFQELAVVPDAERLEWEARMIRTLGARHRLFNKYWNNFHHTPETKARISEGVRRHYRASRLASLG
jgi:hypothetical protein